MRKQYLNNATKEIYTLKETKTNKHGAIVYVMTKKNELTGKELTSTFLETNVLNTEKFTEIKEEKAEKKKERKLEKRSKCNKETTEEKIKVFVDNALEIIEKYEGEGYTIKGEECKANKLLLVYTNNKRTRNITEIFIKVRNNIISLFLREEELASGIEYDAELAKIHKEHRFNFWIEAHIENSKEALASAIDTIITNHKNALKTAK